MCVLRVKELRQSLFAREEEPRSIDLAVWRRLL